MSKICPLCGGVAVFSGKNFWDEDIYECTVCHEPGHHSRFKEQTVFDHITQNREALAPCFVEKQPDKWDDDDYPYYSCLTKEWYATEDKAIAATVEELKKEWKG